MINIAAWVKGHKPETVLGVGGIGATVLLALRARSKNAASSTTSSSSTPDSTVLPTSTADTTDSDAFNGIEEQVTGLQSALLGLSSQLAGTGSGTGGGTSGSSGSSSGSTAPATAPATPATSYGYGTIDTALGEMVWLGTTGPGGDTSQDYQVGGGAPVYFGNASSLAQGGTKSAGVDVYTPVADEGLVSQKAG